MTGSGGWPMTVFMTPDAEPFFCGTYFPERGPGRPAVVHRPLPRPSTTRWTQPARQGHRAGRIDRRPPPSQRVAARRPAGARDRRPRRGGGRPARRPRPAVGWLRPGAEVPAVDVDRLPPAPAPPHRVDGRARRRRPLARRHGRRRHLRPRRRRLRPLLGGRPVAGPALREDALRQRAPHPPVPPRLAAHGRGAAPRGRDADGRVPGARHAPPRRRLLLRRGRRLPRARWPQRGGPVLDVDARRAPRRAGRRRRRVRPSGTASPIAATSRAATSRSARSASSSGPPTSRRCGSASARPATCGPDRVSTTRCSPSGTPCCSRRSRRRRRPPGTTTGDGSRSSSASSSCRTSGATTGGGSARGRRTSAPSTSPTRPTTPRWSTGSRGCTS